MGQLEGKIALVTGGGSGIGLGVARLYIQEGASVAITGRDGGKLRRAAAELAGGNRLIHLAADVAQPDQVQSLVRRVTDQFGRIDILVNNAGLNIKERTMRELTPEKWQLLVRANLYG